MTVDGHRAGISDKGEGNEPWKGQPFGISKLRNADCHLFLATLLANGKYTLDLIFKRGKSAVLRPKDGPSCFFRFFLETRIICPGKPGTLNAQN
jgi:hypothetical protein